MILADILLLLAVLLFAFSGLFLSWIAKFYRLKFKRGPSSISMQIFLSVLLSGALLNLKFFSTLPSFVASLIVATGAVGFGIQSYRLYRTLMSPG